MNARDALEFIAVGASAIQVGTASFIHPRAAQDVLAGLREVLEARGVRRLSSWRGVLAGGPSRPELIARERRRA
jgi:dihydroorotate dehydrogenase (NAD+) catalytic subunit